MKCLREKGQGPRIDQYFLRMVCFCMMAASKPVEPQSGTGLPRWQVALMVGAPILIGAGAVYLWNRSRKKSKKGKRNGERETPEGSASPVSKPEKPDGDPEEMNPLDRAQAAKNKGNKYFKAAKYEQAIQCYSEAISRCPTEQKGDLSTFYQNRAAAFEQQQKWQEVVDDCTRAVELNPRYVKALFRRAKAQERLDNKKQCLEDVTAVCILEAFQNQQSMLLADKVLKLLGKEKAKEKYKNREPLMPSPQFIKSYFSSFTDDIISQPLLKGEKADEDKDKEGETAEVKESSGYLKAKQFMEEENYDKIISECTKEIETRGKYVAEALLLRATFNLLIGNATAAKPDLDQVINMQEASVKKILQCTCDKDKEGETAEVKESSGYLKAKQFMEEENYDKIISECTKEIETRGKYVAEALLLRATFNLLIGNATAAKPDLDQVINMQEASVKLRANALIKRGSMYMQQQQPMLSTQDFNMAADIDSQNADVYHHRGQLKILLDQVEEAVGDFDKCIILRPDSALAQAQKCFALHICSLFNTNTLCFHRGNLDKAIDMFNKAINLAKSEMEMAHLYSLCDAAYAQTEVAKKYGLKPPTL
ncbi:UNVERIFIED_CONTAM: hypothetical protein FKN15_036229 [Acipenser sinensis]